MSKREVRYYRESEVRSIGDGNTLVGYIAIFNSLSEDMGFYEKLVPGCFASSLTNDVRALVNHNSSACVGRISAGTLRLAEDSIGLKFELDLPDTSFARDLKVSIGRKDITGNSFGFAVKDDEWLSQPDGTTLRLVKDVDLFEVSVGVTFPAYADTTAQLRSLFPDGKIEPPTVEKRDLEDCECSCAECASDDCDNCSDLDCDEEFCSCNMRSKRAEWSNRSRIRLGLALRSPMSNI